MHIPVSLITYYKILLPIVVATKMTLRIFENKEQAQIIITDNGKGISSDNLPHIFERLYQCDHSRASKEMV